MKFASLGSGSEGNALLISTATDGAVDSAATTVMLDCGFSLRETELRLARLGMTAGDISAIVVTHEHSDHVSGVFGLARRYRIPVWLSRGTYQAVQEKADGADVHFCRSGDPIEIGALEISPYAVPHDAREPLQYVASDGCVRLGVLTDAGHTTPAMIEALSGCNALMLECNHDRHMLAQSAYPSWLKRRIGGLNGHLANEASTEILKAIDKRRLKAVVGAHLSKQNNTPELALAALREGIESADVTVTLASQEQGYPWLEIA